MGKPGVENSEKIIALVLAIVVFFWTVAGLTNLGFSLLNTIFLGWMFRNYPGLIKDKWALIWGFFSLVLGWMVGIRSYELVKLLSMAAVFVLDTLISGRAKDRNADITAIRITQSTLWTGFNTFNQIIAATTAIKLGINKNNNIPVGKIGLGIVLGIPLVVLFGSLLISADPIFEQLVLNIKWPEINPEIVARGVLAIWFFGQSLSLVRTRLKTGIVGRFEIKQFTEINIAVGMVEVLFLIYSLIQIRYWGVGAEELRAMGITYSDYTRQGYFELIATSILAWVMVIGLD